MVAGTDKEMGFVRGSTRLLPTSEETKEHMEKHECGALEATRIVARNKLYIELQDIRQTAKMGLPVEERICDVLEVLVTRTL